MFVLAYPSGLLGIVFDTYVAQVDISSTPVLLGIVFDTCVCEMRVSLCDGYRFPQHSFRFFSSALLGIVFDTYILLVYKHFVNL